MSVGLLVSDVCATRVLGFTAAKSLLALVPYAANQSSSASALIVTLLYSGPHLRVLITGHSLSGLPR